MSVTTLFLWFKFMYFFRIFESTGFLVSAILTVAGDMGYFLVIFILNLLAFGDALKVMSYANEDKD